MKLARPFVVPIFVKDDSVRVENLHPMMLYALSWVARVWRAHGADHVVITSGNDAMHLHGGGDPHKTLHDDDRAIDLRTWPFDNKDEVARALRSVLGAQYDVVAEPDHIHLEVDPF